MLDNISDAASRGTLYTKSSRYIGRAFKMKEAGDLDAYHLFASVALELLGKAALAHSHPCLVVAHKHRELIFMDADNSAAASVRTVSAWDTYRSLERIVPEFDQMKVEFCNEVASRRNAEIHSGESPFIDIHLDDMEGKLSSAFDVLLKYLGSSQKFWIEGKDHGFFLQFPEQVDSSAFATVGVVMDAARNNFQKKKNADQKRLLESAKKMDTKSISSRFKRTYDKIWKCKCTACGSAAFAAGNQSDERTIDAPNDIDANLEEVVVRTFSAEEFVCPSCNLELVETNEIYFANKDCHTYEMNEPIVRRNFSHRGG